ncbi:hypothetical protein ASD64_07775 [Mesorhizobium sp. Root157]|uniref:hypothetical protein n=1 Tax=Mesorhizobium sp. Root157 TaxID=1736477 RepID=UPI0006F40C01|nr:hypothetical protein [Mesorhizobium sp. Root157]KQZ82834.1 hypothetical protein ASD64_07775 [Mesorhizobium sp. Root157]
MRGRGWAGRQAAEAAPKVEHTAAYRLAVLIGQGGGNMLAPAGSEILALCDHLCTDPQKPWLDGDGDSVVRAARS